MPTDNDFTPALEDAAATARLNAAAPNLLRIVRNIVGSHRDGTWETDREWFAAEAKAAIAKATRS